MSGSPKPRESGRRVGSEIDRIVGSLGTRLERARRHLHRHPELAWHEEQTASFVASWLDEHAVPYRRPVAKTGLVAQVDGRGSGPLRAFRAEMDALPIAEVAGRRHGSRNAGASHACGHDLHLAVALGVAAAAGALRERLRGSIRILFQPAEEVTPSGAPAMIRDGAIDGVGSLLAVHCDPTIPCGAVGLRYGVATAATDTFEIAVRGRGGHSARPHLSSDAILAAARLVEAIALLPADRADPLQSAVARVGMVSGGEAPNVIAGRAVISGTLRSLDPGVREELVRSLEALAPSVVAGLGCTCDVRIERGAPGVRNDPTLLDRVREAAIEVLGPDGVRLIEMPSMGGEDFAWYGAQAAVALVRVGTGGEGHDAHLHTAAFDSGDAAIAPALRVVLRALLAPE